MPKAREETQTKEQQLSLALDDPHEAEDLSELAESVDAGNLAAANQTTKPTLLEKILAVFGR